MTTQQIIENISKVETFRAFNDIARELKSNKRFAAFVRDNGEPAFTTNGIKEKYGVTYYTWIDSQADAILRPYFGKYKAFLLEIATGEDKPVKEVKETPAPVKKEDKPQKQETTVETKATPEAVTVTITFELPIMGMLTEAAKQLIPELTKAVSVEIEKAKR